MEKFPVYGIMRRLAAVSHYERLETNRKQLGIFIDRVSEVVYYVMLTLISLQMLFNVHLTLHSIFFVFFSSIVICQILVTTGLSYRQTGVERRTNSGASVIDLRFYPKTVLHVVRSQVKLLLKRWINLLVTIYVSNEFL